MSGETQTRHGTQEATNGVRTNAGESPEEGQASLSEDEIFHVLQTSRRRDALRYLQDTEGSVRMRDLAEQVAAWEHDTTLSALTSKERQRVYIALYQSHLPKLDKLGIIDYNQSRGIVERTPAADQFDPYLDSYVESTTDAPAAPALETDDEEATEDASWGTYYLGVAAVSTLLLGGSTLELGLQFVSPTLVATVILGLFTALTLGHFYAER